MDMEYDVRGHVEMDCVCFLAFALYYMRLC